MAVMASVLRSTHPVSLMNLLLDRPFTLPSLSFFLLSKMATGKVKGRHCRMISCEYIYYITCIIQDENNPPSSFLLSSTISKSFLIKTTHFFWDYAFLTAIFFVFVPFVSFLVNARKPERIGMAQLNSTDSTPYFQFSYLMNSQCRSIFYFSSFSEIRLIFVFSSFKS